MIKKLMILFVSITAFSFAQLIGPKISVQSLEYDFGEVTEGKIVTHNFIISNTGGDLLKITNVRASCGCTVAQPEKSELQPGESTKLKVDFNSEGRIGKQERYVYLRSNDEKNPELRLKVTGVVVKSGSKSSLNEPSLNFPQKQHNFGIVQEGKVYDYTFKFSNNGSKTVNIKDIITTCGCTVATISSKSIAPGQSASLRIEFDSTDRLGRLSRDITLITDDAAEPNKILKIYADVKKGIL